MIVAVGRIRRVFLILLLLPLISCGNYSLDEQQLMDKADAYLADRNISAAVIELKNALQANPDNARARYLLAGLNLEFGDFATAAKEFRRAEAAGWSSAETRLGTSRALLGLGRFGELRDVAQPDDAWPAASRANLLALQAVAEAGLGDTARAAELVAQAGQLDPAALRVLMVSAQLQILDGRQDGARAILDDALARYPDNQELMLLDASTLQRAGDMESAAQRYGRVLALDPPGFITIHGRNARLQLSQLQIVAGQYAAAEATLRPLRTRNPDDPVINYLGGVLAFEQGDYVQAEQLLLKVLKLAPEHNPTRLLYGTVNFAIRNYEQAAYFLGKYLAAVPDNLVARKLLARSYILLDRADAARDVLGGALSDETADAELLALVGLSDLRRGVRQAGIAELEQALKLDAGNLPIRTELARAYIEAGDTAQAISELRSMLAAGGDRQQAETLLVLAHLRAGDFPQAIKQVLAMLRTREQDPAVQTLAGNVFAASGDAGEARRYLRRALQLKPGLPPALLTLAHVEEQAGNYQAAAELNRQLVDMKLSSAIPMLALARIAQRQGDTAALLDWLKRAVDHAPGDSRPRVLLAEYYLQNGSLELARPLLRVALEKTPHAPMVLAMQGRLFMAERNYAAALKPLGQLLSQEPGSVPARLLLGECYLELDRPADARPQLEAVLEQDAASVPAMSLLARLEIESGNSARALELGRRLQQDHPGLYLGYELAGDALMASADYQAAGREYARAREYTQRVELVLKQAESANRAGNLAAAAGYLQEWLAGHPEDSQARQFLGTTWQDMGKHDLAIAQYERVLELDANNPVALNNLAGLYLEAGRPEALGLAQRALQAAPDNPGVMDTCGWAQVRQGDARTGLRLLEQAMQRLPDNPEVRYHRAAALLATGDRAQGRRLLRKLLDEQAPFSGRADAIRLLESDDH